MQPLETLKVRVLQVFCAADLPMRLRPLIFKSGKDCYWSDTTSNICQCWGYGSDCACTIGWYQVFGELKDFWRHHIQNMKAFSPYSTSDISSFLEQTGIWWHPSVTPYGTKTQHSQFSSCKSAWQGIVCIVSFPVCIPLALVKCQLLLCLLCCSECSWVTFFLHFISLS